MDTVLNVDSKIVVAFEFRRSHEFDAHGLGTVRNGFGKLKVAGLRHRRVAEIRKYLGQLKRFFSQCDHIEQKIHILRATRFFNGEFHSLRARDDEVVCGAP
jgi:hypothetical protein